MAELINFFSSAKFLGILLLAGGTGLLLIPNFYGWFSGKPRHFWFPKLNYEDADIQSLVRFTWLSGIVLVIIGSFAVAANDNQIPNGVGWMIFEIIYSLIGVWIILKAILLIGIIVVSLWNWGAYGTPLFKKTEYPKENT